MQYDKAKESTIELLGITALVCSAACGIQQFVMSINPVFSVVCVTIYSLAVIAWLLFMKMKKVSVILTCISTGLMFLEQAYLLATGAILFLSVLLMLFCIIAVVVMFVQELHLYIYALEKERNEEPWNSYE